MHCVAVDAFWQSSVLQGYASSVRLIVALHSVAKDNLVNLTEVGDTGFANCASEHMSAHFSWAVFAQCSAHFANRCATGGNQNYFAFGCVVV